MPLFQTRHKFLSPFVSFLDETSTIVPVSPVVALVFAFDAIGACFSLFHAFDQWLSRVMTMILMMMMKSW